MSLPFSFCRYPAGKVRYHTVYSVQSKQYFEWQSRYLHFWFKQVRSVSIRKFTVRIEKYNTLSIDSISATWAHIGQHAKCFDFLAGRSSGWQLSARWIGRGWIIPPEISECVCMGLGWMDRGR